MSNTTSCRLFVISEHFAPSTGATAQLVTDLVDGLRKTDIETYVITSTRSKLEDESVIRLRGLGVVRRLANSSSTKALQGLVFLLEAFLWITLNSTRQDGLLILSNPPFIGLLGATLNILRGQRYIFVFQDLFPRTAVLSNLIVSGGVAESLWNLLMKFVCSRSTRTVVLSKAMEQRLRLSYGRDMRLQTIHNWAVEKGNQVRRRDNAFAIQHGFSNKFTIQYSGNFGRLHDMSTLLEAARMLKDEGIEFVFIGDGARKKEIIDYTQRNLLSNVLLLSYQDREQLPMTLSACDMAAVTLIPGAEDSVAPSKFYGILASKRAVILVASKESLLAQLIVKHRCGLVVSPRDSCELAKKIFHLSKNQAEVERMGERGYDLYRKNFGLERSVQRYGDVVNELWQVRT